MAEPAEGLPPCLVSGLRVALVPPALHDERFHVVLRVGEGGSGQLVQLSGIEELSQAKDVVGKHILARRADLAADFALHDAPSLLGRQVVDAALGELGHIQEVMQGPANDVWVVEGPFGEVLLPVVKPVVEKVPEYGAIFVCTPEGLIGGGRDAL